jgi:hypothetical protein
MDKNNTPTLEQLEQLARDMNVRNELVWTGFREDSEGRYTLPVISSSTHKLVLGALKAFGGQGEAVMWAYKSHDGTWSDASRTEHSSGMYPLYERPSTQQDSLAAQDRFVVSVVMVKEIVTGINTQNKLYNVEAVSQDEAHGKAIRLAQAEFPGHRLHTVCSHHIEGTQ